MSMNRLVLALALGAAALNWSLAALAQGPAAANERAAGHQTPLAIFAQRFGGPVMAVAAAEDSGKDLIGGRGEFRLVLRPPDAEPAVAGRLTVRVTVPNAAREVETEIVRENSLPKDHLDGWRQFISGREATEYH